jgi:hypothetical protein
VAGSFCELVNDNTVMMLMMVMVMVASRPYDDPAVSMGRMVVMMMVVVGLGQLHVVGRNVSLIIDRLQRGHCVRNRL